MLKVSASKKISVFINSEIISVFNRMSICSRARSGNFGFVNILLDSYNLGCIGSGITIISDIIPKHMPNCSHPIPN